MHALSLQLAPLLAAEKSKTPFYIAGGVLIVWAFGLSLAVGTLRPEFPTNSRGERLVIAISVVLVAATLLAAVATSGSPEKTEAAKAAEAAVTAKIAHEAAAPEPSPPGTAPAPAEGAAAPAASETGGTPSSPTTTTPSRTPAKKAPAATSPHQPTPNATKLALSVPGTQLAYNTKALAAKAGSVTIAMTNTSPIEHNVTIAEGSKVLGATPTFIGGTKAVTLNLKPGKYTFYCSVPGHRQAGMEGTLVIK